LHTIPYRFENFVGFISAKHPLAKKSKLTIAEVAHCPLIVKRRNDSKSSYYLKQMTLAGYQPNVLMQCESAEAIKLAVSNGMGLGFLYEDYVKSEIRKRDLKVVKVEGINPPDVQSFIVFNKNHALSRNGEAFLSLLASAVDGSIPIEQFSLAPDTKVA
jgi:DNA-binding transcriptional LysR family regulator